MADALARVIDPAPAVWPAMPISEFPQLLSSHMRRIRASAAGIASEIGMSREAINNWRNGDALPSRKHRDKVLATARYLRLSESETNQLLAAVGFEAEFPGDAAVSAGAAPTAVADVLDRLQQLRPYPILMLLSQAHVGQPPEREAMLVEARRRYGVDAVLHLQPPYSLNTDAATYFAAIATQCGMPAITSDHAFEAALGRRLQSLGRLFCLVSRFEQGDAQQREVLAGILRSLSEMHSGQLHLLICGGEALSDLKFQGGDLSLLNIATAEVWPDLQAPDLQSMAQRRGLINAEVERALRLSGGHPLLADAALSLLATASVQSDADLTDALAEHPPLWASVLPLLADSGRRGVIAKHLLLDRLAPARPYLLDPVLRSLYWANLIVARRGDDGAWLEWRCPAVRRAVAAVLEQFNGTA